MTDAPLDLPIRDLLALREAGRPVTLVDCREQWEYDLVRLEGARHIPLAQIAARAAEVPTDGEVVVYCHHGVRSRTGALLLRRAGVAGARSLAGGIDAWSATVDPALPRY